MRRGWVAGVVLAPQGIGPPQPALPRGAGQNSALRNNPKLDGVSALARLSFIRSANTSPGRFDVERDE